MKRIHFINLLVLLAIALPVITLAAGECVPTDGFIPSDACIRANGFLAFAAMINKIINWFVSISVSIAALTFAYGGAKILFNPENPGAIDEGKEMLKKTVIGMLIILGAWLVVHSIISALVNPETGALRFLKG
jgi:hypothetical protein